MEPGRTPVSLTATAHWTDDTVLAGDDDSNVTTLMALTPTGEGEMRIDPVTISRSGSVRFTEHGITE